MESPFEGGDGDDEEHGPPPPALPPETISPPSSPPTPIPHRMSQEEIVELLDRLFLPSQQEGLNRYSGTEVREEERLQQEAREEARLQQEFPDLILNHRRLIVSLMIDGVNRESNIEMVHRYIDLVFDDPQSLSDEIFYAFYSLIRVFQQQQSARDLISEHVNFSEDGLFELTLALEGVADEADSSSTPSKARVDSNKLSAEPPLHQNEFTASKARQKRSGPIRNLSFDKILSQLQDDNKDSDHFSLGEPTKDCGLIGNLSLDSDVEELFFGLLQDNDYGDTSVVGLEFHILPSITEGNQGDGRISQECPSIRDAGSKSNASPSKDSLEPSLVQCDISHQPPDMINGEAAILEKLKRDFPRLPEEQRKVLARMILEGNLTQNIKTMLDCRRRGLLPGTLEMKAVETLYQELKTAKEAERGAATTAFTQPLQDEKQTFKNAPEAPKRKKASYNDGDRKRHCCTICGEEKVKPHHCPNKMDNHNDLTGQTEQVKHWHTSKQGSNNVFDKCWRFDSIIEETQTPWNDDDDDADVDDDNEKESDSQYNQSKTPSQKKRDDQ
jgi:hypothetical protein